MYINISSDPSIHDSSNLLTLNASFDVELSDFPSSMRNTLLENYKTLLSRNIQMFHDEYLRFHSTNNSVSEIPSFQSTQKHLDFVSRIAHLEREKLQAQSVATNNTTAILDMKKHLDRLLGVCNLTQQTPTVAHAQPIRGVQPPAVSVEPTTTTSVELSNDEPFIPKDGFDYVTMDKIAALVPANCEILLKHVVKEINGSAKGLSDYAVLFSKNKSHIQSYNGVEYFQRKGCHYLRKCVS